ncbi:MAG: histidinol-phosphate transaminase [Desulfobacterales bacterium]|jgi:histidinol-phosphate aminotransferase|nr:histidinol-phosphate transaminase [Desulfobacterales bacterium]
MNKNEEQGASRFLNLRVPSHIAAIKPYEPGKPLDELEREYGISDSVKLASNENPLGPSPLAVNAMEKAMGNLHRYPDGAAYLLNEKLAGHLDVPRNAIVLGNGSDEIIGMLTRALLQSGDEAVLPKPSFLMYDIMIRCADAKPIYVPLNGLAIDLDRMAEAITSKTRLIFVNNPNNPTGTIVTQNEFEAFLKKVPEGVVVVMDEAYIEFARDERCASGLDYLDGPVPVVTLRTFSKAYGLAGLRVGYGVMPVPLQDLLNRVRQPFNVSSLAQIAAVHALDDTAFLEKTLQVVHEGLDYLYQEIDKMGLRYFPTQANFFLIDVGQDAAVVFEKMLRQGVIVRSMVSYGFPQYIRINAGLPVENRRFIQALKAVL